MTDSEAIKKLANSISMVEGITKGRWRFVRIEDRPRVNWSDETLTYNGVVYANLGHDALELFAALIAAGGNWIHPTMVEDGVRPSEIRKRLPEVLRNLIQSKRGKGTRLSI